MVQKHPFHLVDPSPQPLVASTAAFMITSGSVGQFHGYSGSGLRASRGFVLLLLTMYTQQRDIIREGTFEGQHTVMVQTGLRQGMALFIVSEVMFFFAFFQAFFQAALAPTPEIGSVQPPRGIEVLSAQEVPFLNTLILLTSGASVTQAHHAIVAGSRDQAIQGLLVTVALAIMFTALQVFEYVNASFTISDSVYGSTFYMATGFHGFHVFIGTCIRTVCLLRVINNHFTRKHHFGFEAGAQYQHFVDVVQRFLFVSVYQQGGH